MGSFICLSAIIFVFSAFDKAFSATGYLEINYDHLPERIYHANNSRAIYSPESTEVILGCMFPPSTSAAVEEAERYNLQWSKEGGADPICAQLPHEDDCGYTDTSATTPRGMRQLKLLLVATGDSFKDRFGGSGTYTCYHSRGNYYPAQVNVWVAGSLLEIFVNGSTLPNRMYELPEKTVSETDRKSVVLDCAVTAAAKGLVQGAQFVWYRNEQRVQQTSRFVFHDTHSKRLEIKNAGSSDGGVYMCEADLEQQNGTPIKSRQYVVLQGDLISIAASTFPKWHYQLSTVLLLLLVRITVL